MLYTKVSKNPSTQWGLRKSEETQEARRRINSWFCTISRWECVDSSQIVILVSDSSKSSNFPIIFQVCMTFGYINNVYVLKPYNVIERLSPSLTRKCHPHLPSQRLRYPHGNKSLDLLCAKHVDATTKLWEMILPQPLLHLLHALTRTHKLTDKTCWRSLNSKSSYVLQMIIVLNQNYLHCNITVKVNDTSAAQFCDLSW